MVGMVEETRALVSLGKTASFMDVKAWGEVTRNCLVQLDEVVYGCKVKTSGG